MIPLKKYLKDFFTSKKIWGGDSNLNGLVKADHILRQLVDEQKVPGISVTILQQGKTVFQKGFGFADLENKIRVYPNKSIFRIASVSKNIAATALARMVGEGLIDLDASFYTYVPYYPKKKWDFTIRQLASHTAGIRGYRGTEYGLDKPYTIKESIEIFKDDDLVFEPGTDYLYNSFGWVLISLAMQEACKTPFEDYVADKILNPLGMRNTFAPERDAQALNKELSSENIIMGHTRFYTKNGRGGFRPAIPVNNFFKLAGGGYLSTSADIARFGQAVLDGKVLNQEEMATFVTSQTVNGLKTFYGLGWQVSEDSEGRNYVGHVGNGVGGYSNLYIYPDYGFVFAILVNCTNPGIQDKLDECIDLFI